MKKFIIKSYTGTVHYKRPVVKLNQLLRFVSKYTVVHIRYIVNPDKEFPEVNHLITSPVQYLDLRSLSKFAVSFIESNCDDDGDYLTVFVYDPDYDLPF